MRFSVRWSLPRRGKKKGAARSWRKESIRDLDVFNLPRDLCRMLIYISGSSDEPAAGLSESDMVASPQTDRALRHLNAMSRRLVTSELHYCKEPTASTSSYVVDTGRGCVLMELVWDGG